MNTGFYFSKWFTGITLTTWGMLDQYRFVLGLIRNIYNNSAIIFSISSTDFIIERFGCDWQFIPMFDVRLFLKIIEKTICNKKLAEESNLEIIQIPKTLFLDCLQVTDLFLFMFSCIWCEYFRKEYSLGFSLYNHLHIIRTR